MPIAPCLSITHLLFLSAHTSHVLQPSDLSVFSPPKAACRPELNLLSSLIDSAPIGKKNFLLYFQKAREASITAENISSWLESWWVMAGGYVETLETPNESTTT